MINFFKKIFWMKRRKICDIDSNCNDNNERVKVYEEKKSTLFMTSLRRMITFYTDHNK